MYHVAVVIGRSVKTFTYQTRYYETDHSHTTWLRRRGVYIGDDTTVIVTSFDSEAEQAFYFKQTNYRLKAARFLLPAE